MPNCDHCKKKTFILLECKCGKKYCIKHRTPEDHKCNHNYDLFQLPITSLTPKISII
jgi:hypothetical protein